LQYAAAEAARERALAVFVADAGADMSDEVASRLDLEIVRAPVDGVVLAIPTGACTGDLFALRADKWPTKDDGGRDRANDD
jgi:hypothetical protein